VTGQYLLGLAGRVVAVQRVEDMHSDHPQQSQAASHIDTDHPGAAAAHWGRVWRSRRFDDGPRLTARARYNAHAISLYRIGLAGVEVLRMCVNSTAVGSEDAAT
jgi:hypothetical protein